jgi:type II secretory pathway pseudopilin PulG
MTKDLDNLEIYQLAKKLKPQINEATLIKGVNGYIKFLSGQQISTQVAKHPSSRVPSFTLIELLVSLGIIVFVIIIATGIFVYTLGGQQKTTAIINLQQDGQYLISMIAKDVRDNWLDYSYYSSLTTPEDELALVDDPDSPQTHYVYRYNSNAFCVEKCVQSTPCQSGNFYTLTMTDVKVSKLDFYIEPTTNPFTYGVNILTVPRVTVVLELRSTKERFSGKQLRLQETIPQRREEKK